MRSNHRNLLNIAEFCSIIGLNHWYVAQYRTNVPFRGTQNLPTGGGQVQDTIFQFPYQNFDRFSREDIGDAITRAEQRIADLVDSWPAPRYITNEIIEYPQYFNRASYGKMYTFLEKTKSIRTKYRNIVNTGIESLTLIEAGAAVVRSDTTGDGVTDRFTVTSTVPAGTAESSVVLFVRAADRNNEPQEYYEIRPIAVSITGTTATITGAAYLLAPPDLTLQLDARELDATNAAHFLTTLDVYTRTVDTSDAGQLRWEQLFTSTADPPATVTLTAAAFGMRSQEYGWLAPVPAEWDAANSQFDRLYPSVSWRPPDRVQINYLAGYALDSNNRMQGNMQRAVAYLAAALLPARSAGNDRSDTRLYWFREMPAVSRGDNVVLEASTEIMNAVSDAFGVMGRGAVEAYRLLQKEISTGGELW